jgi:hypothetical protein
MKFSWIRTLRLWIRLWKTRWTRCGVRVQTQWEDSGAEACHRLAGFCRNPESQQTLQAGVFRGAIS